MTFREILTFRNIPWRPHQSNSANIWMSCPICQEDRLRLGVDDVHGKAHCFNCDWKSRRGTLEKILRALTIADKASNSPWLKEQEAKRDALTLPEGFYPLNGVTPDDDLGLMAIDYLVRRGFSRKIQNRWHFGVTFMGRYAYRIIMPIYWKKELVMYVARDITGQATPKYLNSDGPKYFWGLCKASKCDGPLFLCEGIFKGLALREHGVKAAAMMGMTVTDTMVEHLLEYGHRSVVVWPDPGRPGVQGAVKLCRRLNAAGISCSLPWPLPEKQADEGIDYYELKPVTPFLINDIRLLHRI